MPNHFIISDTHFGHGAMLGFKDKHGHPARSGPFSTVEGMDEHMVSQWNKVVRPCDKVYHLGDVLMNKKHMPIVERLHGKKSLVMGNHDIFDAREYLRVFKNVRGIKVFDGFVLTHIPVHGDSLGRFHGNVHGHVHSNSLEDPRYFNVCVEVLGYTPIAWEDLKKSFHLRAMAQKGSES